MKIDNLILQSKWSNNMGSIMFILSLQSAFLNVDIASISTATQRMRSQQGQAKTGHQILRWKKKSIHLRSIPKEKKCAKTMLKIENTQRARLCHGQYGADDCRA